MVPSTWEKIARSTHLPFNLRFSNRICVDHGIYPIKSVGMHLFNTTASAALGSLPAVYCDENFSSASVDLGSNKSHHQLVTEYGYLHQFSHGQSLIHQKTSTFSFSPPIPPAPLCFMPLDNLNKISMSTALYIKCRI